ncbi:MAG: M23 family metallopeptidase [Candidatus Eisenbacteria bacterium]|nr:M23 family metallopeptidase [Candidatus Eisenbacteria bacterium]
MSNQMPSLAKKPSRSMVKHVSLILLVVFAFAFLFWEFKEQQAKVVVLQSQDSSSVAETTANGLRSKVDTLGAGTSLYASFLQKDVPLDLITSLLEELGKVMDLKKTLPGESYELVTDARGALRSLRYVKAPGEVLVVEPAEEGLTVFQENVPLTKIVRRIEGEVKSSLYDAVRASGGDAELAMLLSDIFAWDVDFFTDPRSGDRFSVLVEQYMRGEYKRGYGDILVARYQGKEISREAYLFKLAGGNSGYFDGEGKSLRRAFLRSPLNYRRISSFFTNSRFHPILKRYRPHHGVDYSAKYGTPVVTIGDGTVKYAGWKGGFGRFVTVRHNSTYISMYGHLSRFGKGIRNGAKVRQGQVIAYVGSSGLSTGPHLDFRITRNGSFINPLKLSVPTLDPVPNGQMTAFRGRVEQLAKALDGMPTSGWMSSSEFGLKFFPDSASVSYASGQVY